MQEPKISLAIFKTKITLQVTCQFQENTESKQKPVALPSDSETSHIKKVKVKCTLVQALRLCTGPTAHRGSRGIALQ